MIKKCENCDNEFKTYKKGQKYCNRECSAKHQRYEKKLKICEFSGCTNTFEVYDNPNTNREKRFCSRNCQVEWQKFYQLGENNGNYGLKNSWGTHDKKTRKLISRKVKESWNNPDRLEKHLAFLERYRLDDGSFSFQDEIFRNKISKANINRLILDPKYGAYKNCKRGWYKSLKSGDEEYYHSSWEEKKMIELDEDSAIKFWTKKHGYVIEYLDGDITKRYLPDFLINDGVDKILEVKGYIDNINNFKLKTEAALIFFNKLGIDYDVDFMFNSKRYDNLIIWINNKKKYIYGKN
jgi:hypothetical protein